jgi:hypothetical protein
LVTAEAHEDLAIGRRWRRACERDRDERRCRDDYDCRGAFQRAKPHPRGIRDSTDCIPIH